MEINWDYLGEEHLGNVRVVTIEKDKVRFFYYKEKSLVKEIALKIGYEFISGAYFKQDIPNEVEIEYAINYIEDELMSKKELINNGEKLVSVDKSLIEFFNKNGEVKSIYTQRNIEDIFGKYASIVMGEPLSRNNMVVNREDIAIILVLREIVHHLNFMELYLIN